MRNEVVRADAIAPPIDLLRALPVVETVEVPPREARYAAAPSQFAHGKLGDWLRRSLGNTDRLYLHQALALASIEQDLNVVVSTATASGKSLVFMAAAIRKLLAGDSRILVFYVQKALGSDQLGRWRRELKAAGLSPDLVAEITGAVPVAAREKIISDARIILATPDVAHAWMMPARTTSAVSRFLGQLDLLVLDEAHAFEAAFGSHASLFIRRLRLARQVSAKTAGRQERDSLQIIATTATLADPLAHMKALTGLDFVGVGEIENGAPSHGLTILHIEGPDIGSPAERLCADLVEQIADGLEPDAALIAFADTRQGVERIIRRVGKKTVLPYRSGYTPTDRRAIEKLLHKKHLRGVVATSALELGIDLPQFSVGLTLGVPPSRKSLRQRIGRVGRARAGIFAVIAPATAFSKLGSSLADYVQGPVDDSPLYLDNQFIHFQHARCVVEEGLADFVVDDDKMAWPAEFIKAIQSARPGVPLPRMLEETAAFGRERPHLAYSLRAMPGEQFVLRHAVTGETIGTIDHEKAVREAYPGASYYHYTKEYRVENWRSFGHFNEIELRPMRSIEPTQPLLKTQVAISMEADCVIEQNYLESVSGSLAEVQLQLTESVEGYRYGSTVLPYSELSQRDRRLRRKSRRFPTIGILLRINEPWFAGDGEHQVAVRRMVAEALQAMLASSFSVSLRDLRGAHIGIAMQTADGTRRLNNGIVICDNVAGGLRLSEPLATNMPAVIDRLREAAESVGEQALLPLATVRHLERWHASLRATSPVSQETSKLKPGQFEIFTPGSTVAVRTRDGSDERKIIAPAMVATGAGEQLMYQYESAAGVLAFVAHDQAEPCGEDWSRAVWDPSTGTIQPIA